MRDGFIIHNDTLEQIRKMTPEQIGELVLAMDAHYQGEDIGEVSQITDIMMITISKRMDADAEAYEKTVEQKKAAAAKRWNKDADGMRDDAEDMRCNAAHMRTDADGMREPCGDHAADADIGFGFGSDTGFDSEKPKKKRAHFVPPTLEEVREYCQERGNGVDPEAFVDYYASQKWKKANGQPVSDWKGCVRTWEKRDKEKPAREPPKKAYQIEGRKYSNDELERMLLGGRA